MSIVFCTLKAGISAYLLSEARVSLSGQVQGLIRTE